MSLSSAAPFRAGPFLFTPQSRTVQRGVFHATLSIRRGQGNQTHDRVYTFKPEFTCRHSALVYAAAQGHQWLANPKAFA